MTGNDVAEAIAGSDQVLTRLENVRAGNCGFPVTLVREGRTGRFMVRVEGDDDASFTLVDLLDLVGWLSRPANSGIDPVRIESLLVAGEYSLRHQKVY